jgi:competence protein ComGF
MMYRVLPLSLVALSLALFVGATALADDTKAADRGDTHDGTVISVTAEKLVMKDIAKNGVEAKELTYRLADKAVVTCDGKKCKLEELKADQKIRVTNKAGDNQTIVKIEALNKNEKFEKRDDKENVKKDGDKSSR